MYSSPLAPTTSSLTLTAVHGVATGCGSWAEARPRSRAAARNSRSTGRELRSVKHCGAVGLARGADPLVVRHDLAGMDGDPAGEPALDELVEQSLVLPGVRGVEVDPDRDRDEIGAGDDVVEDDVEGPPAVAQRAHQVVRLGRAVEGDLGAPDAGVAQPLRDVGREQVAVGDDVRRVGDVGRRRTAR